CFSTAREHGRETSLGQNPRHFRSLVALDFDLPVFHSAADAARFLHLFGEHFFFRKTDADKIFHDGDGFPAAMSSRAKNIHTTARLFFRDKWNDWLRSGRTFRKPLAAELRERIVTKFRRVRWNAFLFRHFRTRPLQDVAGLI